MLNLIKAELYKYVRVPYMYLLIAITSAVILSSVVLLSIFNSKMEIDFIDNILTQVLQYSVLIISLFTMVLSEDYRYGSMKNLIVSTTSKVNIFWGKFIAQCIIAFLAYGIVFSLFIVIISIFEGGLRDSIELYTNFLIKLITVIPVLVGILSLANLFVIVIKNDFFAIPIYFFTIILSEKVIMFLSVTIWDKLEVIREWLIMPQLMILIDKSATQEQISHSIVVGLLTIIISMSLSSFIFVKREVN